MVNNDVLIKCDKCEHEFFLNAVGINEAIVDLNGVLANLVYFACPKCNKIYRVSIQDKRYYEMKEDLEKAKARIQKYNGRQNSEMSKTLHSMVVKKHERLKNYVELVNTAFPGTFIFVASENNHEEKTIKYLPYNYRENHGIGGK